MINNTYNNNLTHVSEGLDEILTNMLVRCMLNPDNKDFYIGTMTLDKVRQYFAEMPHGDTSVASVFWNAYSRAEAEYLNDNTPCQGLEYPLDLVEIGTCPECGCRDYIQGVACPNCDYVEEV